MPRGGRRIGAGRKPKDRTPVGHFETAEEYLEAVVRGDVAPDAVRVQAAKTLIAYQTPRQRVKAKSPSPKQIHQKGLASVQKAANEDFEQKAAVIRAKYRRVDS